MRGITHTPASVMFMTVFMVMTASFSGGSRSKYGPYTLRPEPAAFVHTSRW